MDSSSLHHPFDSHARTESAALWAPLERLLTLLRDFVAVVDLSDRGELLTRIDACRRDMAAATDLDAALRVVERCHATCGGVIVRLNQSQSEQEAEIAALLGMVREALAAVAGDGRELNNDLRQSMTRFAALVEINDPARLKLQLGIEVRTLRTLAEATQQRWDTTCRSFTARIDHLHDQLVRAEEESNVDALTGLVDRRAFEHAVASHLSGSATPFVIAVVDIDRFKSINDTFGHLSGDEVIVAIAKALKASVRSKSDVAARLGGDEFGVVLTDSDLDQVTTRLRIVSAGVAATFRSSTPKIQVTVSGGVAMSRATDGVTTLIDRADQALYKAKREGRNRIAREEPLH